MSRHCDLRLKWTIDTAREGVSLFSNRVLSQPILVPSYGKISASPEDRNRADGVVGKGASEDCDQMARW